MCSNNRNARDVRMAGLTGIALATLFAGGLAIITVSGAHRAVGKTTLARALKERLPGRVEVIKIGHGPDKGKPERLFRETEEVLAYVDGLRSSGRRSLDILIVESNRILDSLKPDLALFLEPTESSESRGKRTESDAAPRARLRADFRVSPDRVRKARRLPGAFRREARRRLRAAKTLDRRERAGVIRALQDHALRQGGESPCRDTGGQCG